MTKIKNTKKGMAKRTLSISLAVAMLATSNVPVWAADFTDGTDAVFTSEAPVEVEAPVAEAPVVEDIEAPVAEAEPSASLVYDDTALAKFTMPEWDVTKLDLPAIHYKDGGEATDGFINAYWMYNGKQIIGSATSSAANNDKELAKAMDDIAKSLMENSEITKERCIEGGEFSLDIKINANGGINFHRVYNFGSLKAVDLSAHLSTAQQFVTFDDVTYSGKEEKPEPKSPYAGDIAFHNKSTCVSVDPTLSVNDFSYDYVRDINGRKDIVSADARVGGEKPDVLLQVSKPGYTGTLNIKDAYSVKQRKLKDDELDIRFSKTDYEFTGDKISPSVKDVTAVNTATGDDLTSFIGVVGKIGPAVESAIQEYVYFDYKDKGSVIYNYEKPDNWFESDNKVNVIKRDLSKCTVEMQKDYSKGEIDDMIRYNRSFEFGKDVKLYDADHNELTSLYRDNYYLENVVFTENGKYYVTVKATKAAKNSIVNENTIEISTPQASLRRAKVYFEAKNTPATDMAHREFGYVVNTVLGGIEYTGESYQITKDDIYVVDHAVQGKNEAISDTLYDIECDPTYGVGKHWIKIVGKGDYAGSTLTVWYDVTPASYKNHTLNKEVVFNDSYTKAEQYADAIALNVQAFNEAEAEYDVTKKVDKTVSKTFDLTAKDMDVKYDFVELPDANEVQNKLHNHIRVTATITNKDFLDTANMVKGHEGVTVNEKDQVVIEKIVEIVHPSIAEATVEVLGEYTFTGKKIIPEVKVTAADGTVLKENEDYRLEVLNSEHATTDGKKAQVIVTAIKKCDTNDKVAAKTHYEFGTTNDKTFFDIAPADITKITANEFTYNGEAQTPSIAALGLTLNKVSMTRFFNVTRPKYFDNNVNAGTATVELSVKDEYAHDFTAASVKMPFKINPYSLDEKDFYAKDAKSSFIVYGANGHIIDFRAFEGFAYDGTEKTFKDADFKYAIKANDFMSGEKYSLKKGSDYTVEYADNVNPDQTGRNEKTSYVYVKLSPNFVIVNGKDVSDKAAIKTQNGSVITNVAAQEKFFITKASVEKAEVTVENPVYNLGKEVAPKVTVTVDGKTLTEDKDYVLVYDKDETFDATAENSKIVTVKGINGYVGSSKVAKWGVDKKAMDSEDVKVELDKKSYKPNEEPKVLVVVGKTIINESEYTVAYTDKENGVLTITGADKNFTGAKEVTYAVSPRADLADAKITGVKASYTVTGEAIKPEIKVIVGNTLLAEGEDYVVTYGENTAIGKGSVTVTAVEGNPDYKGTQTVEFEIKDYDRVDLAAAEVTGIEAEYEVTGEAITADKITVVLGGKILTEGTDYTVEYKNNVEVGTATVTIKAVEGSKEYTGQIEKTFEITEVKPLVGKTMIDRVEVVGNKATVILSGETDGAAGYDYVISKDADCINNKNYDKVNKNFLKTESTFQYVDAGTYYAYCHAWVRGEDGKKVFGEWSEAKEFTIESTTPGQPVVTSVKVDGSTVTVTYTEAADALGYDVVLGTEVATVNREKRPVKYGEYVKKGQKKTTVTFKNVEAGTYYVGLHAFNRTPDNGKKVFSPWSNIRRVVVK